MAAGPVGRASGAAPPSAVARAGPSTLSTIQALGADGGTAAAAAVVEATSIESAAAANVNLLPFRIANSLTAFRALFLSQVEVWKHKSLSTP